MRVGISFAQYLKIVRSFAYRHHGEDREFIIEFLHLYREYPALWKILSTEYSDRNLKNNSYKVIIKKYKEVDQKQTRKKNSLRTNFRKELKKVKASYGSGTGSDHIYVPSLWYFNQLFFLKDQEISVEGCSTITSQNEQEGNVDVDQQNASQVSEKQTSIYFLM